MNITNFTKDALLKLPSGTKQYQVSDTKISALKLRVGTGGCKTFILYKKFEGRPLRIRIGGFPTLTIEQARTIATSHLHKLAQGINPNDEKKARKLEKTFGELFEIYYKDHALVHTKRPEENKAILEFHILPHWKNKRLSAFDLETVNKRFLAIGEDRGRSIANRVFDIVSAIFNFGLQREHLKGQNPCSGLKKFPKRYRDRFLLQNELTSFFEAISFEEQIYQDFFMLAVLIGARKNTMLKMKYSELDFQNKRWRLSEDQSKNNDVNIFILVDVAIEILQRRASSNKLQENPSKYVFPGTGKDGHLNDPRKAYKRIKARMKVDDITIHDLRRTLGSYMTINGSSLPIIGKALNHKSLASTAIYARLSNDPVLSALNIATEKMLSNKIEKKLKLSFALSPYNQSNVQFEYVF